MEPLIKHYTWKKELGLLLVGALFGYVGAYMVMRTTVQRAVGRRAIFAMESAPRLHDERQCGLHLAGQRAEAMIAACSRASEQDMPGFGGRMVDQYLSGTENLRQMRFEEVYVAVPGHLWVYKLAAGKWKDVGTGSAPH